MGGEGLEEVVSAVANPSLQTLYNGKSLEENYRELNLNDVLRAGELGMLMGLLGSSVDITRTGYGTSGGTELSTPYSDILREKQPFTPYGDVLADAATMGDQTANHADQTRYQELERKFLDGSIAPEEADELWRLESIWGQFDAPNQRVDGTWEVGEDITRAEWDEWQSSNAAAKNEGDYLAARFFGVNGTKKLGPIIKRSTTKTQGGFECFPDGDPLKRNVQSVKPIKGFFDVAMHGEPDVVCFGGRERNMTARVLASVIRHSEGYTGQNIRLLSCSTGKCEGDSLCFAEELANALGVTVQAPNLDLYIYQNGIFKVGRHGEGAFVEYAPNERRRLK